VTGRFNTRGGLAALCLCVVLAGAAVGRPSLSDDFVKLDPRWDNLSTPNGTTTVANGAMTVTALAGRNHNSWYTGQKFTDADVVVTARAIQINAGLDETYGVVFGWNGDVKAGYYAFVCACDGKYSVQYLEANHGTATIPFTSSPSIHQGANHVNRLRVTLHGGHAEYFINDASVGKSQVSLPEGGFWIGFWSRSNKSGPSMYEFSHFHVDG
jgi:hypothetical protein